MAESLLSVLVELVVSLGRVLWLTAAAMVGFFLPTRPKDVSKEIVLVTGAASGIGRLIALKFAAFGAKVVLWDVNQEANDAMAEEIKEKGLTAFAFHCDLSKREDIYKTAAQVKRDVGDVTVLINNAGVVSGKKFFEVSDDLSQLTFEVNTMAHFWTIKAFVPAMMAKNHGHVITIASSAGLFGVAGLTDYCSSKFGAVGIHESLTSELVSLKHTGVHTTCVCPFFINTGMFDGVRTRFPILLPILKPEYAVKKIMDAYHSNQRMLMMPRICYIFYFIQGLLPKSAMLEMGEFMGVNRSMDTFRGRVKQD